VSICRSPAEGPGAAAPSFGTFRPRALQAPWGPTTSGLPGSLGRRGHAKLGQLMPEQMSAKQLANATSHPLVRLRAWPLRPFVRARGELLWTSWLACAYMRVCTREEWGGGGPHACAGCCSSHLPGRPSLVQLLRPERGFLRAATGPHPCDNLCAPALTGWRRPPPPP